MDPSNRANNQIPALFSRGSTPPIPQQQFSTSQNASPNQIDSLFHHLSSGAQEHQSNQSEPVYLSSAPVSPVMTSDDQLQPQQQQQQQAMPTASNADRQSALLSLLGGAANARAPAPNPQQVPTPPSASTRSGASPTHNEAQGKILLEQLMSGNPPMSNYSDPQRGAPTAAAPSPPYATAQREGEYRSYQHESSPDLPHRSIPVTQQPPQQTQQQQQQQQPPSPRKSMFDFVSPFDALSGTATGSVKKKPVPVQPSSVSSSAAEESGWTNLSDPKRQSVDNLLEHLTRGTASQISGPPAYDSYLGGGGSDYSQTEPSRAPPPPLPPKPVPNRTASPRASPPKTHAQRAPVRLAESPASQQSNASQGAGNASGNNRRDKESSPGPRGGFRKGVGQGKGNKNNNQSPSPQAQSIIFDVSQPLDEIQASRDAVKSTAIALVKQDPVFLSGTTIGATHWVAYAMTRGRVRVISRSSGDRTLLQLPTATFPSSSSVSDMAVHGNRLAGVTSDGGFVVWELPEVITDDVPGQLLLCVPPVGQDSASDALHSVKWHPKEPDTLAVASQSKVFLIDLTNVHSLRGQPIPQSDLPHISQAFSIPSPLVAFDFDILHYALATISEDSTLIIWNIHDKLPYTTHKIRGEDVPSSLTYVDGGIVVGRKNGTIFQLLSMTSKNVLSTIKFVNGGQDDPDMFGHVSYDARIQTLWVANCRRESLIALKIHLESTMVGGDEAIRGYIDQVVEFAGPKPTIHFVILTADADPNGDEAHAACIAAKLAPGELALVAFSVHSSGVDQILIRKEWFETALANVPSKFPAYALPPAEPKARVPAQVSMMSSVPVNPPPRMRTPPSEDLEGDAGREEGRLQETKGKGAKGKNVNWKEKEDNGKDKDKDKNLKNSDAALINESALGQALSREIRKMEESLHTRIGRLIGKEMDKQHQRLEDARAHDQSEDFARQEKILKLISTELTRNTTRVVEMAVKSEVQNSVLPALENITKNEVKAALNEQVSAGFVDYISQTLPIEIEKLLLRPDISAHFAQMLSSNLTPLIDRHVKDTVNKSLMPAFSQQSTAMHQDLLREVRTEIHSVKSELTAWQGEAFRSQETSIRELEHTVRTLAEQVKFLSLNPPAPPTLHQFQQPQQVHNSPGPSVQHAQPVNAHLRQQNMPPPPPPQNYPPHNFQQQGPPAPVMHPGWYAPPIAAPQASHPAQMPQPPPPQNPQERTPPIKADQWDEIYLGVLHTQDASKLRELLAHTNPELIMPLNGPTLVSQAVILTLVHRLSAVISETPPNDEAFKNALWWLQRTSALLRPEDKLITDFIPRVLPGVQTSLVATKQRLPLAPGGPPTLEIARSITEVQDILRRKMGPVQ
ncbi:hypothetical protein B0H16DRAFT_1660701 [Mycena metata]|uniref:Enhancer of mRNA-decapping protein 4 WD40 repeat region domain-containing protein n=1 Tax=Mycena metata TaxID=1033252 RepID=A0AAD7NRI9_9AGAR|nr:hypothetical protein B0H16DRAFT_1660701 [Mycena metata]